MHSMIIRWLGGGLFAAVITLAAPSAWAQAPATPAKAVPVKKVKAAPFTGKVSAVDTVAKTFTITGKTTSRTFNITSTTRFTKAGKPATFEDLTVGEEVGGTAQVIEGKSEVISLRIGVKPNAPPKPKKDAPPKPKKPATMTEPK